MYRLKISLRILIRHLKFGPPNGSITEIEGRLFSKKHS